MIDSNFTKVLGAWGANVTLGFASFSPLAETLFKSILTLSQIGVAIITIVYIAVKIRNERPK